MKIKNADRLIEELIKNYKSTGGYNPDVVEALAEELLETGGILIYTAENDKIDEDDAWVAEMYNDNFSRNYPGFGVDDYSVNDTLDEDEQDYEGETMYDRILGWCYSTVKAAVEHSEKYRLAFYA